MHPDEFWWFAEAMRPKKVYAGKMSEDEVAEIYEETYGPVEVEDPLRGL